MAEKLSRRAFHLSAAMAVAAPAILSSSVSAQGTSANGKIRVGVIGCNGMGASNLANTATHPDVVVTAICDVSRERREAQAALYPEAQTFQDFREMLAAKRCDAVIVASPPHWHCLHAIAVLEAGMDLYLQKPMTLHLAESLAVKNAVKKHQRICQVGTQVHQMDNYRRVVERIQGGAIGEVKTVFSFNLMNQGPEGIGRGFDGPVPDGVDWDLWIGPGPKRTFNQKLYAGSFEHGSFMVYSGGWTPNMAPHIIDLPIWALNLPYPSRVYCSGGRYLIQDDGDAPDVQEMIFTYPNCTIRWSMNCVNSYAFDMRCTSPDTIPARGGNANRRSGTYFLGQKGTLWTDYVHHEIYQEGTFYDGEGELSEDYTFGGTRHEHEWIDCVKSRKQPSCCPDYHCKVDVPLVLGNLSMKLGRSITLDPETLQIVGDDAAAQAAIPEYQNGWKFPMEYLA